MTAHAHLVPNASRERVAVVRRATVLNRVTLSYNGIEATMALTSGVMPGSFGLIGFGLDSIAEDTSK